MHIGGTIQEMHKYSC